MKAGNFSASTYLDKLHEAAELNTSKGFTTDVDGLVLPDETKKHFDWLKGEYQKGKTEVKVEVKGEGSSFKPGYDLQTDLKSVKDFQTGMYGQVKTEQNAEGKDTPTKTEEPKSPKNKKEETTAEDTDPKDAKETSDESEEKTDKNPKAQQMEINLKTKKKDDN